jgi:hypothetical protein
LCDAALPCERGAPETRHAVALAGIEESVALALRMIRGKTPLNG